MKLDRKTDRALRVARRYADGGDVDQRSTLRRALDTGMDYAGRGLALADLYSGGMLSSAAGLVPGNSIANAQAARDRALEGVPRDWKAAATEPVNPLVAMAAVPAAVGTRAARVVDNLGFYSKLDEVLGSLNPKDKVTAATLQQRGVKAAELEARGVSPLFAQGAVPVSDIQRVAGDNRVQLRENQYRSPVRVFDDGSSMVESGDPDLARWRERSLDPDNPTYRESVIHIPSQDDVISNRIADLANAVERGELPYDEFKVLEKSLRNQRDNAPAAFQSGHFDEPNIVGHTMTSMTKHEGRPVYTIDQIQSDWGQQLRDGGVRDEAKIGELRAKREAAKKQAAQTLEAFNSYARSKTGRDRPFVDLGDVYRFNATDAEGKRLYDANAAAVQQENLLAAELRTAEATTPGNPLVNTTDQWVNTTLRRALRAATDQNADYVAIPSGRTVLSYNPGDQHGMAEFYDNIVPRRAQDILGKLDKESAVPLRVDQVETPSKGLAGQGFTLFNLTPKAKEEIKRGLPMFGLAGFGALGAYPYFSEQQD